MAKAVWVVELSLVVATVDQTDFPIADLLLELHSLFVDDDHSVVGCVRDNDQVSS